MSESKPKTAQAIFEDIQKLDPEERNLLDALILQDDLNAPEDEEITQAWVEEVDRRDQLHREGTNPTMSEEEVFAKLQARLDSMKQ